MLRCTWYNINYLLKLDTRISIPYVDYSRPVRISAGSNKGWKTTLIKTCVAPPLLVGILLTVSLGSSDQNLAECNLEGKLTEIFSDRKVDDPDLRPPRRSAADGRFPVASTSCSIMSSWLSPKSSIATSCRRQPEKGGGRTWKGRQLKVGFVWKGLLFLY